MRKEKMQKEGENTVSSDRTVKSVIKGKKDGFKTLFIVVFVFLFLLTIAAFGIGLARKAVSGPSEDLRIKVYEWMEEKDSGFFSFLSGLIFGDDIPAYESYLPPSVNSNAEGISVLFGGKKADVKEMTLTKASDGVNGKLIAVSNPTAFAIGSSTLGANALSEIAKVEHARLAFSFAAKDGCVIVSDREYVFSGSENEIGYFGFTESGIMHFGMGSAEDIKALSLAYATKQTVYSLICGGVPCDFDMSKGKIGSPSLVVAQCEDGSVLLLFADASASCLGISELLYRYNAVNAAIIYVDESVGYSDGETSFAFNEGAESTQHSCAWRAE